MKKIKISAKRIISVMLISAFILACCITPIVSTAAEVSDLSEGKLFDIDNNNMLVGSSQLIDGSSVKVDDASTLELQKEQRVAGWGWNIKDDGTGNEVLEAGKKDNTTYVTAGALRLNDNNKFIILKPAQSYYVSVRYKVLSTHVMFTSGGNTYPGESATSSFTIGYDSRVGNEPNSGNRMPNIRTVLATPVKANNTQGTFTSTDEFGVTTTKKVGEWYTEEIYFTTPAVFESYSQHFAIAVASHNGFKIQIDDIYIKETPTVSLHLNGGSGEIKKPALVGAKIEIDEPVREGYTFVGWYKDEALSVPFTDTVFTKENCNISLYAKWQANKNIYVADFYNYNNVTLNASTYTENNFSIISDGSKEGNKMLNFDGRKAITAANRAFFPLAYDGGNIKLKSNTTYVIMADYTMQCEMAGSKYKLRVLSASANNINDGAVIHYDEEMPSGDYRHYISFTTGEIPEGKDAAYIEFSYKHSNVINVAYNKIKVVQIDDGMSYLRAYDTFSYKTYEYLGNTGDKVDLPVFTSSGSFEFDGWYTDESFAKKHSGVLGSEKLDFAYSFWANKPEDFENFVPFLADSNVTVGKDIQIVRDAQSYEGAKMLKYSYNYVPNYFNGESNAISLAKVYDKITYKVTFKYKLDSSLGDFQFKFFTAHRANRWCYITNYDEATYTVYSSEAGKGWQEATVYLTTNFIKQEHSDGLFMSFNPVIEGETVVCVDNFTLEAVKANEGVVAYLGKDGKAYTYQRADVGTNVTAITTQPKEYFSAFKGWYSDKECSVAFKDTTVQKGITYVYSKWNEAEENFEGYLYSNRRIVTDNGNKVLKNGSAILGAVEDNATYLVTYKYKTGDASSSVYFETAPKTYESAFSVKYTEEGSILKNDEIIADNNWHTAKRFISTSFFNEEANMLYANAIGDIAIDEIAIKKIDVLLEKGTSALTKEAEETENSQALRFYYSYVSDNGATVMVDGEELTLVERGIVLKNATADEGTLTVENAETAQKGYAIKNKTYGFGNYWSYEGEAENYFVPKFATYSQKVSASLNASNYVALPNVDANGENFASSIKATNGYLDKAVVSTGYGTYLKVNNRSEWGATEVYMLCDANGAALQVKSGTSYSVTVTYKVPSIYGTIDLSVVAGLSLNNRTGVPAGEQTQNTVQTIASADLETCTDVSVKSLGWTYTWSDKGHHRWGFNAVSDEWQTITYNFTTAEDMTGYLPVVMLGIYMPSIVDGKKTEMDIKDITLAETDYTGEANEIEYTFGEKVEGIVNGDLNYAPQQMAENIPENSYFVGWTDKDGNLAYDNGVANEKGSIVYSYYLSDLYKDDARDISARGYIKVKDNNGTVYTIYSSKQDTTVKAVKAVAAEITDKKVHTISGKNWNRFTIVNPKIMPYIYGMQIENLIEYAAGKGVTLNRVNEKVTKTPYEIIIGDTIREESGLVSVKGENEYVIAVKGTKLIIKGGSDIATGQGVADFIAYLQYKDSLSCGADLYEGFTLCGEYIPASDNYVLTFNEDFDTIDRNKWGSYAGYDYGYYYGESILGGSYGNRSTSGNAVLTKSGETKKLVRTENGNLVLGSAWVTPTEPKDIEMNVEFMHANLSTFYTMLYKYGMLEIRSDVADVPSTTSFWINDAGGSGVGQRQGCMTEYDLIENYGRTNYYASAIHHWSDNLTTNNLDHFGPPSENFTGKMEQSYKPDFDENSIYDNYHIYTFLWEDDKIVFAFDGVKYAEYKIVDWYKENMANCIILSSGLGDACYGVAFDPNRHTDYYETLIDYIKIYQVEDMGSTIIWLK